MAVVVVVLGEKGKKTHSLVANSLSAGSHKLFGVLQRLSKLMVVQVTGACEQRHISGPTGDFLELRVLFFNLFLSVIKSHL